MNARSDARAVTSIAKAATNVPIPSGSLTSEEERLEKLDWLAEHDARTMGVL
jgi:hypothetical protein